MYKSKTSPVKHHFILIEYRYQLIAEDGSTKVNANDFEMTLLVNDVESGDVCPFIGGKDGILENICTYENDEFKMETIKKETLISYQIKGE